MTKTIVFRRLTKADVKILEFILKNHNEYGEINEKCSEIVELLGVTRNTVQESIRKLKKLNVLTREPAQVANKHGYKKLTYRFNLNNPDVIFLKSL